MGKATDIRTIGAALYFLPVQTRVALKFGAETLTQVTCARARVTVSDEQGRTAEGWGETPLSVQWVWPSATPYEERHAALKAFCVELTELVGEHSHARASDGAGPRFPGDRFAGLAAGVQPAAAPGQGADAVAGGAGVLLAVRPGGARRLWPTARLPDLRDLPRRVHEPRPGRITCSRRRNRGSPLPASIRRTSWRRAARRAWWPGTWSGDWICWRNRS